MYLLLNCRTWQSNTRNVDSLFYIFCLTLPLLIPFIAHTVSLMGHRAVKQERFIVARDEEVWKLWAIYWRWRAVYKSISVDQAGPALAAARLVTDYTSCQLEARSQGSIPPPIVPSPVPSHSLPLWHLIHATITGVNPGLRDNWSYRTAHVLCQDTLSLYIIL